MQNKQSKIDINLILILFVGLLVILCMVMAYKYKNTSDKDLWCERNRPQFNLSFDSKVSYCFTEGWSKYCKISYPQDCPKEESIKVDCSDPKYNESDNGWYCNIDDMVKK